MVPAIAIRDIDSCFEIPELKALAEGKNIAEMLLHGEEELECVMPIQAGQEYRVRSRVVDMIDKGKMTIVVMEKDLLQGETLISKVTSRYVLRGMGGSGFRGGHVTPLALP